ncbi:hypothetical protein [Streptomyces sp. NPDC005096]|uniref:hypothetical protein n=1 Tax=Streptomyces sp. NPDC005096 TaxID=3154559 RepID=UPI0033B45EFF
MTESTGTVMDFQSAEQCADIQWTDTRTAEGMSAMRKLKLTAGALGLLHTPQFVVRAVALRPRRKQ